ncbi:MAG: formate/nitrite transporter family protein [Candidatus Dormibacter sp.]
MARSANRPIAGEDDSLPVDEVLGEEPEDVIERGSAVGEARLERSTADIPITAIIGGVEVSLGGLAAAVVIGALLGAAPRAGLDAALVLAAVVFPIGFVFVILGRSELFTENFLIPVAAVVKRDVGRLTYYGSGQSRGSATCLAALPWRGCCRCPRRLVRRSLLATPPTLTTS